jgi:hypothetical protein
MQLLQIGFPSVLDTNETGMSCVTTGHAYMLFACLNLLCENVPKQMMIEKEMNSLLSSQNVH